MVAISESWQGTVTIPANDVVGLVARRLVEMGARLDTQTDRSLLAKAGSQAAIRLKGGWLSKITEFPVEVDVRVTPTGTNACEVSVEARDSLGFGSKAGMTKKYRQACQFWVDGVAQALSPYQTAVRDVPGAPSPSADG